MEDKIRSRKQIMFLSTGNSARSQIAEGLLKAKAPDAYEVFSAGTTPTEMNPLAVKVMEEIGIDISDQAVTDVVNIFRKSFNFVITVCDRAEEKCPIYPLASRLHWSISHPQNLDDFRQVRDELSRRIDLFLNGQFIHDGERTRFHSDELELKEP